MQRETDTIIDVSRLPNGIAEILGPAMQLVFAHIGNKANLFAVQQEARLGNAPGVAPGHRP